MSSQIQITGETKVKSLTGVLVGTTGVVSSLNIDGSLGIPQLDVNGKILVSQLPNSVMEYKGTWNAATNTPTLANGTGNQGDVYLCNVAGTVNFGAGPIAFFVGDQVIYSGSIWQRASGATGTVTSVAVTETGDSLNITGSPITTSGTINIGFNGTNLQYVNGAGNLTTFPILTGYVPYTGATQDVDLGAFKLNAQSLHIKGTAGNGHLGLKHQSASATASANEVSLFADSLGDLGWLNGNLYLSKFITSGNTAARSYTFPNATCNIPDDSLVVHLAGTETITGAKTFSGYTTFTSTVDITSGLTFSNSGFTLVLQPPTLSVNRTVTLPNGTGTLALTSDISYPVTSVFGRTGAVVATSGDYTTAQVTESGNLYFTDSRARLAISLTTTGTSGAATYNNTTGVLNIPQYADQFVGTVTSVAALTIGTSGTDLSSTVATSTTTPVITLNVPTASAANRGALSSADWTTFNNKQSALTNPVTGTGTSGQVAYFNGTTSITSESNLFWDATNDRLGIGTNIPSQLLHLETTLAGSTGVGTAIQITSGGAGGDQAWIGVNKGTGNGLEISVENRDIIFNTGATTPFGGTERMRLTSSGNLGLGVTPSASQDPLLESRYGLFMGRDETNLLNNAYFNSGWKYAQTGSFANRYYQNGYSGGHQWFTAASGTAGNAISFTQAMTLTAAGRLLIGTPTEATYMLDVNGTGRFSGALNANSGINVGTSTLASNADVGLLTNTGSWYVSNIQASHYFQIYDATAAAIRLIINTTGGLTLGGTNGVGVGALYAGAATFSSSIKATTGLLADNYSPYTYNDQFEIQNESVWRLRFQAHHNGSGYDYRIVQNNNGSDVPVMTFINGAITVAQAATFSSTLKVGGATGNFLIDSYTTSKIGIRSWTDIAGTTNNYFFQNNASYNYGIVGVVSASGTATGDVYGLGYSPSAGTSMTPVLNWTSGGNVLIGTTTDNGRRLRVSTSSADYAAQISQLGSSGGSHGLTIDCNSSSSSIIGLEIYSSSASVYKSRLYTDGSAIFASSITASSFFESSDNRLKTLIQDNYQTKGIASITPKLYTKNGKVELGYYAQDFVGVLDSAVSKGSDDMLSLSYREVHTAKIYALEQEIKELKAKFN